MSRTTCVNEMLKYPIDARLLIINADDFGLCHAQNQGTLQAIKEGIVSSCSLMVPTPWALHGIYLLKQNPEIPFGIHLTCVSEYIHYRWRPLTSLEKVPSLVDESGYFYSDDRIEELLRQAILSEVTMEFRAQIETVFRAGLRPTHLDSHYFIHELRADIFDMTVNLALEYGLALRVGTESWIENLQGLGYPTCDFPVLDSGRYDVNQKVSIFTRLLKELPSGLSEWAVHPGIANEEICAIMSNPNIKGVTGTPLGRQSDLDFLTSKVAKDILKKEGIVVLNYKPLQEVWQEKAKKSFSCDKEG